MAKKYSQRAEDLRRALAQEAARIMAEHGIEDFLQAKRKAADRLGVNDVAVLPKNVEIEAALARTSAPVRPRFTRPYPEGAAADCARHHAPAR